MPPTFSCYGSGIAPWSTRPVSHLQHTGINSITNFGGADTHTNKRRSLGHPGGLLVAVQQQRPAAIHQLAKSKCRQQASNAGSNAAAQDDSTQSRLQHYLQVQLVEHIALAMLPDHCWSLSYLSYVPQSRWAFLHHQLGPGMAATGETKMWQSQPRLHGQQVQHQ